MSAMLVRLTVLFICLSAPAYAWGPTGHRATGLVASEQLSRKTRERLKEILGQQSLAMASTWMDEVRSDSAYDYMETWHWVTIPDGMRYEETTKNPAGDLIAALEKTYAALKSGSLSKEAEATHIRILIHLVGDLHMPLHVGRENDQGGNRIKVMWFREDSNLHRVWDSDMIDDTRLSYTELAQSLEVPDHRTIKEWQNSNFRAWAMESQSYREQVYAIGNGRLGYAYTYRNFSLVRKRLLQAGIRLAGLLNAIYG